MPQVIQRYQIEEEFDKEAVGVIYKAKDLQTDEIVELGIIDSGLGEYRSEIDEILSHKHIISKINHENIARLHDFFQQFLEQPWAVGAQVAPRTPRLLDQRSGIRHPGFPIGKLALKDSHERVLLVGLSV